MQLQNTLSEWEDCVQELRGKQTKYRGHMDYMQQEVGLLFALNTFLLYMLLVHEMALYCHTKLTA